MISKVQNSRTEISGTEISVAESVDYNARSSFIKQEIYFQSILLIWYIVNISKTLFSIVKLINLICQYICDNLIIASYNNERGIVSINVLPSIITLRRALSLVESIFYVH